MTKQLSEMLEEIKKQGRSVLTYKESRSVMELANIKLNKMEIAKNLDECIIAANRIGFPIVLKVISEDVLHKSDAGGVKIGIGSEDELRNSFDEMIKSIRIHYPTAKIEGYSVEEMVKGIELLIGTNTDEQFGKMIALGIGGIFVEIYKDLSFRLIPIKVKDIEEMIDEIKGKKLLDGFRGMPVVDHDELVSLVLNVSKIVEENPIIKEMDLNPVVATKQGLKAIDARIILE